MVISWRVFVSTTPTETTIFISDGLDEDEKIVSQVQHEFYIALFPLRYKSTRFKVLETNIQSAFPIYLIVLANPIRRIFPQLGSNIVKEMVLFRNYKVISCSDAGFPGLYSPSSVP